MFNKVNIWLIVGDHINTLRNYANNKVWIGDILLFLLTPIAASLLLIFVLHFELNIDAINALITSLSVFSALLFNLLLLIYDILRKDISDPEQVKLRKDISDPEQVKLRKDISDPEQVKLRRKFLSHIYANISFSILVAVISIALLLLLFIETRLPYFALTLNLIIYFLVINFILTLLMILKRVHILLASVINPPKKPAQ